jgi:sigma-E factor negative regulatory protein RseB
MIKLLSVLVLAVNLGYISSVEASEKEAFALMQRMTSAGHSLNYQGTFVYQHDNMVNTMHIVHRVDKDGARERLVSLDGTPREIIRDKNFVTCILPDDNAVMVNKSRPPKTFTSAFPQDIEDISSYYRFLQQGEERIAGNDASIIQITPRDKYRYGHRLWIDKDSALLLKSVKLDGSSNVIEQIVFTDIQINADISDQMLAPETEGKEYTWRADSDLYIRKGARKLQWQADDLPPGFEFKHHNSHMMSESGEPVYHLVYSDGLAWVSVYIERLARGKKVLIGDSHMGAVSAYGRVIGDYHVTVVGEVPSDTTHKIGDSIRHLDQ